MFATFLGRKAVGKNTVQTYQSALAHSGKFPKERLGKEVIERFVQDLSEVSTIESQIRLEGRTLFAVIAPKTNKEKGV